MQPGFSAFFHPHGSLDYQGGAGEGELAAHFVYYVDLTLILAGRQILERELELDRDGFGAGIGQMGFIERTHLEGLGAFLVEQAHADFYAPRFGIKRVRAGVVDVEIDVEGLAAAEELGDVGNDLFVADDQGIGGPCLCG